MSDASGPRELAPGALRRTCSPDALGFGSTVDVEPLVGTAGQVRADDAITFGLEAKMRGYNIFATGPPGVGKRTSLELHLRAHATRRPASGDWVYLHNFAEPRRPIVVALGCGQGHRLAADMRRFLSDARNQLTSAFESDTYSSRRQQLIEPVERDQQAALQELREHAQTQGIAVELTPAGVVTVPLRGTHPMTPAEFAQLPETVRARYQASLDELGPRIQSLVAHMRGVQRNLRDQLRDLDREVALFAVGHLIDELKERYSESTQLVDWLAAVAEDVTENLGQLKGGQDNSGDTSPLARAMAAGADQALARYEVNVFVSHQSDHGAPVVTEINPTFSNVFGRVEHQGMLGGGLVTNHLMLQPGAVHRANGGYLMLPAAEVLSQPLVWRKLKEMLRTNEIRLENPADQYALFPTATLTPEPIPLDVKVVLVGSPLLYELAYMADEDVRKLFRVKAQFDGRTPWDDQGARSYAAFLSSQVRSAKLHHFDAAATARLIEHGARLAESQQWLSTQFVEIAGLAAEASHWAEQNGKDLVDAEDVEHAIELKARRSNLIEQRLLQMLSEGTLLLDVEGERVGQINGLSVIDMGDYSFGHPLRITATAGPGRGSVVSIERETELSGHIHDKGFLILSGYLRERYGGERRIALGANLTFEQSYEQIDGDSAASAELYALLSELADVPLRQDIAVTGSVNQHGELQAIGGVNEKIEGFYRACKLKGLTGSQGVIIPEANTQHLMLGQEVVDSVEEQRFHVWSARNVDQGIELLTGHPAGRRGPKGAFPEGTVHARVEQRLERWAQIAEAQTSENGSTRADLRSSAR